MQKKELIQEIEDLYEKVEELETEASNSHETVGELESEVSSLEEELEEAIKPATLLGEMKLEICKKLIQLPIEKLQELEGEHCSHLLGFKTNHD